MKKIAIVHYSLGGTGGLSKLSTTIANYWSKQGHEVIRIGLDKPYISSPYKVNKEVKQIRIRNNKEVNTNKFYLSIFFLMRIFLIIFPLNWMKRKRMNKILNEQDVIIVQNPLVLKWLSRKNRTKTTLYMHHQYGGGALMGKIINFQQWSMKKKVKQVVCLDIKTEEILNQKFKNIEFKFIPNFIAEDMPKINPKRNQITFMGRLSFIKNIDWIIYAATQIEEDIYLYGNISPDYQKTWDAFKKPSNLKYMGRTNNVLEILSKTKIGLHTGLIEGYSLSMIESACSGNILVSAASWDSYDPELKDIIHIASTKEEFAIKLQKAIKENYPSNEIVKKLRKYYSFEKYVQKLEIYLFKE